MNKAMELSGIEQTFAENEIIVSKTDLRGRITYANDVFVKISGFSEAELLGQPHSIMRHPDMPACIFNLLWQALSDGKEIFSYIANRCRNGDHYWVFATFSPSYARDGTVAGYHSCQRVPNPLALKKIKPLYTELLAEEAGSLSRQEGIEAAVETLNGITTQQDTNYDKLVFSLQTLQPAVS